MRLKDNLYNVTSKQTTDGVVTYTVTLCPECFIYKAHFPGKPITPGVCLIGMSKELLEDALGQLLEIKKVKNAKFLSVVTPGEDSLLAIQITKVNEGECGEVSAQFVIESDRETKAKMSLVCVRYEIG